MKSIKSLLLILAITVFMFQGCTEKETTADKINDVKEDIKDRAEDVGDKLEDVADKTEDKIEKTYDDVKESAK